MKVINLTLDDGGSIYVVAANISWLEEHNGGSLVHLAGEDALVVREPIDAIAALIATW